MKYHGCKAENISVRLNNNIHVQYHTHKSCSHHDFLCDTGPASAVEPEQQIDYNFAQQEFMMKEYSNDPIQEAIIGLEKQYEEDKQGT